MVCLPGGSLLTCISGPYPSSPERLEVQVTWDGSACRPPSETLRVRVSLAMKRSSGNGLAITMASRACADPLKIEQHNPTTKSKRRVGLPTFENAGDFIETLLKKPA